jgi:hypothetical protein
MSTKKNPKKQVVKRKTWKEIERLVGIRKKRQAPFSQRDFHLQFHAPQPSHVKEIKRAKETFIHKLKQSPINILLQLSNPSNQTMGGA